MKEEGWQVYLRLITPLIGFIVMLLVMGVRGDISRLDSNVKELDAKMFKHLTNDELHSPRSIMLPRAEFGIYLEGLNIQLRSINNEIVEIKNYILDKEVKLNRR